MGNQGSTFGKRQREQNRKDKARAKQERLAGRRGEVRAGKGPPIASFAEAHALAAGPSTPGDSMPPGPSASVPAPAPATATATAIANREVPGERPAAPPPQAPRRRP
jgi:hypothetical protein